MLNEFVVLGIVIPVVVIILSIIGAILFRYPFIVPLAIFLLAMIGSFIEVQLRNVGWLSLLGWTITYTLLSLLVAYITKFIKSKKT